jgi:hypothetical protein
MILSMFADHPNLEVTTTPGVFARRLLTYTSIPRQRLLSMTW